MQKVSQLIWRTGTLTALVVLLTMAGLTYFLVAQLHATWHGQLERRLVEQAQTLARQPAVIDALTRSGPHEPAPVLSQATLSQAAVLLNGSIAVLGPDGQIWADTGTATGAPEEPGATDLSRLPEVRAALTSGTGISLRTVTDNSAPSVPSAAAETPFYFVAAAVTAESRTLGVVRLMLPYAPLAADFVPIRLVVIAACVAATLVLAVFAAFLAERRAWKLRRLTRFAGQIAAGNPDAPRLHSINRGELVELAQTLHRVADKLKSQSKKRARAKDRLITIMHVMTDGVVILNKYGHVRLLNPAAERILNTSHQRALDRTFVQTARDHRIAEVWERCRKSESNEVATVELSNNQFVRVVVTPLLKRTARGYLVILQDLTEVRRLQTIRQDFVSNVSHELRTPLASLRALVETLRDGALDDPPAAQRFLDRMEVEVDALTQMVAELLELSRIESGQAPLRLSVCEPAQVLGVGAERLRPQTERAEIELTVHIPADLPEILVDSGRIQQVLTNLVHNAIKFTPPGGKISIDSYTQSAPWEQVRASGALPKVLSPGSTPPALNQNILTESSGDAMTPRVVVKVQDTGMGIQENELARIFERFYKTDRSRAMGGTGLGLAISKHIIQAHGGDIWAESDGKSGSAFFIALPLAKDVTAQELTVSPTTTQDFSPLGAEMESAPAHAPENGTPLVQDG